MRAGLLLVVVGCGRVAFDPWSASGPADGRSTDAPKLPYNVVVIADQPVAYWRLGDANTTAIDQMGHYNGTYKGNVAERQPGATSDGDGSVRFNDTSTTTNMFVNDAVALRLSGTKTLEVWYNPNGNVAQGTYPNIISKGALSTGYLLYYFPPSDVINYRENGATEVGSPAVGMKPNGWNHVVFVYDASNASNTLYVNDVRFPIGTKNWGTNADASVLAIGTIRTPAEGTTSSVDEVAIYDHALTAAQVHTHFAAAQ